MSTEFTQRVGDVSVEERLVHYTPVGGMHISDAIKQVIVLRKNHGKPVFLAWQRATYEISLNTPGEDIYTIVVEENLKDL